MCKVQAVRAAQKVDGKLQDPSGLAADEQSVVIATEEFPTSATARSVTELDQAFTLGGS